MRYDENEIQKRVKASKKSFLIKLSTILLIFSAAIILVFLDISNTVSFISGIAALILALLTYLLFESSKPKILFSRELRGENIKEHEYVAIKTPRLGIRARIVIPNTRANRRAAHPNIRANIYLRLDSGDVVILSMLNKAHADLYNEGDVLLKYEGTKYPIVISRNITRQPCPICGAVNEEDKNACCGCGLSIIK